MHNNFFENYRVLHEEQENEFQYILIIQLTPMCSK